MSVMLLIQTVLLDSQILDDSVYFAEGFIETGRERYITHPVVSFLSPPPPWLARVPLKFQVFSPSCSPTHSLRNPPSPTFVLRKSAVALRFHPTQQNKSLLVI